MISSEMRKKYLLARLIITILGNWPSTRNLTVPAKEAGHLLLLTLTFLGSALYASRKRLPVF
jgi:hypothetical protein